MIFKYSFLALVLLLCKPAPSAPNPDISVTELLQQLLDSITKSDSKFEKRHNWHLTDPMQSASGQDVPRIKPLAAPPPAPALGAVDMPVAWPYPPAPKSGDNSEFPLLDRFLKNNGVSSNVQNNQINSNSLNQQNSWFEQQISRPKPSPSPTPAPVQWNAPTYQDSYPRQSQTPTQPPAQPPAQPPQYIEWGVPQKAQLSVPLTHSAHPSLIASPISPVSAQPLPPPLNPNDNFYIQHNRQSGGQPKHFSLDTIRMNDNENENPSDKLNVSFIMPPNMRPLSLNFDTGEVQIDFGDKSKNFKVETIPSSVYNQNNGDLSAIFRPQSSGGTGKAITQEDDDYIVVRHDMNKYTYDLPKGAQFDSSPQQQLPQLPQLPPQQDISYSNGKQTGTVEKYDVSGKKNLHFVLGRVSV